MSIAAKSTELAERLKREAKFIARLEHPGIVPVHDAGVLPDGRVFYVMKLVRGERLDVWAKGRELRERLRMFRRSCEAMAFAHAHEVLHRDLKPENVMVGAFGEALVMDWGLARSVSEASPAGLVMGTPAYMAPEQARGENVTSSADVYGLGAILYALLSGRAPGPKPAPLARRRVPARAPPAAAPALSLTAA